MSTRKRRAPGTSPQAPVQTYQQDANVPTEQYMNWNDPAMSADMNFNDPQLFDSYGVNAVGGSGGGGGGGGHNRVVSLDDGTDMNLGQLVRRNPNHQLAPAPRQSHWEGYASPGQQWEHMDNDEELEQKAAVAKKDAQAKRKQIPPFVQKLSSFLDNNKNENLIRWSDDGNSFIVLDEDEFARTLIPELFKHNNYASFVRQLNMYGFHKKVGLSDNSMKASETKAKAPSEYYNKYFKRGRPELLWLIQKPKNPPSGPKRKRDEENKGDSDEERKYVQDIGGGGYVDDMAVRGNEQMAMIPRSEYNSLRVEVQQLQQQQKLISNVLSQIKRQNDDLYSRATSFQALHDRHENSINAILTFLATFYNRSLEGNTNGLNLADMFPPAMQRQQSHGNVVDVDDYPTKDMNKSPQLQRTRRPLALLPAPTPAAQDMLSPAGTTGRASTMSPTTRPIPSPITRSASRQSVFRSSTPNSRTQSNFSVPQARDSSSTVPLKAESPQTQPPLPETDDIMSAIQTANANASASANANVSQPANQASRFDFPSALSNYQTRDGHVPLTPQQRNDVLSLIATTSAAQNNNNALTNPLPSPEISNLLNDLSQFQATQQQLELLQKMSEEQNSRVQSLQERLQPLSPSGQIPGINTDVGDGGYFSNGAGGTGLGDPGAYDLDLDAFVQDQDYFTENNVSAPGNADGTSLPDFNFSTPDLGPGVGGFAGDAGDAFSFDTGHDDALLHPGTRTGGPDATMVDSGITTAATTTPRQNGTRTDNTASNEPSPVATVEEVEDETRLRPSPKRRRK